MRHTIAHCKKTHFTTIPQASDPIFLVLKVEILNYESGGVVKRGKILRKIWKSERCGESTEHMRQAEVAGKYGFYANKLDCQLFHSFSWIKCCRTRRLMLKFCSSTFPQYVVYSEGYTPLLCFMNSDYQFIEDFDHFDQFCCCKICDTSAV